MDARVEQLSIFPENDGVQDGDAEWVHLSSGGKHRLGQFSRNGTTEDGQTATPTKKQVINGNCPYLQASRISLEGKEHIHPRPLHRLGWHAHQDHEPRVDFEKSVQVRFTRYAVVCPEVALPLHNLLVTSEGFEGHSRSRRKYLQRVTHAGSNTPPQAGTKQYVKYTDTTPLCASCPRHYGIKCLYSRKLQSTMVSIRQI